MKSRFVLLWLLLLAMPSHAGVSVLSRDGIQSALLSPDGEYIAVLIRSGDVDKLLIVNAIKKNTAYYRKETFPLRICSVAWVDDESLAIQIGENMKYQVEPKPTGEIEILKIAGDSIRIGGANSGDTALQQALTGKNLIIGDGLSRIPDAFLVIDQIDGDLWRIDFQSDSIEPLDYPPFRLTRLSVSPNTRYMAAEGINDTGEKRVMVWSDVDDRSWRELDAQLEIVSVNDSGIAYAIMELDSGITGLVAVATGTGTKTVLFRERFLIVDQVMVDSFNNPFAVRFVPGYPSWFYLDAANRLTNLHKSFRAALPHSDISFISSSIGDRTIIAKQTDDDYPSSFFVVNTMTSHAERLGYSRSGLSIVGGEEDEGYSLQPFGFKSETGSDVSGYVSVPQEGLDIAKPTIVMLRDMSDESRWQWGFDVETWFFQRQGFNVLMVNGIPTSKLENPARAATLMSRISDVEDAIHWSVQEDITDENQLCFFGRGTGAEMALLMALRSDIFNCVISLGGTFENLNLVAEIGQGDRAENRRLRALFIYGTDDSSANLASQNNVLGSLTAFDVEVDTMPILGERRVLSSRQNEVRAFARISSFLEDNLVRKDTWPTLPLTYEQALAMDGLHEALIERSAKRILSTRSWRKWFDANDDEARKLLFDEQLSLYESYQAKLIKVLLIGTDQPYRYSNRPRMRPLGQSSH